MGPTDLTLEAAAMITSSGAGTSGLVADLTPAQLRRVANDLTATMQAIYTIAPAIYKRPLSADLAAPVTSTLTATDGSDVVTTSYAFGEGCSVYVGGVMNEIRTEGGVKKLRFPFVGTSGSQAAVFYSDAVVLDSTVGKVIGPVSVVVPTATARKWTLDKLVNRADAEALRWRVATCRKYWVEPVLLSNGDGGALSTLRLRMLPIPDERITISYDVALRAPSFTVDDLGTDAVPSTKSLVVAEDYVALLVRPIFLQMWAGSSWVRATAEQRKRLEEDDKAARMFLRDYRPQQESNRHIFAL